MSIYVARTPYRSSFSVRSSRMKLSFPKLGGLKKLFSSNGRASRRRLSASSGVRTLPEGVRGATIFGAERKTSQKISFKAFLQKAKDSTKRLEFGPSTVIVGLLVLAVGMSLVYLMHFNKIATKGYDLRRLEAARQDLMTQYDIKNMKLAEVKSMNTIINSDRISAMRKPGELIFVRANTALASTSGSI